MAVLLSCQGNRVMLPKFADSQFSVASDILVVKHAAGASVSVLHASGTVFSQLLASLKLAIQHQQVSKCLKTLKSREFTSMEQRS